MTASDAPLWHIAELVEILEKSRQTLSPRLTAHYDIGRVIEGLGRFGDLYFPKGD